MQLLLMHESWRAMQDVASSGAGEKGEHPCSIEPREVGSSAEQLVILPMSYSRIEAVDVRYVTTAAGRAWLLDDSLSHDWSA